MANKGSNKPLAAIYAHALYGAAEAAKNLEQVREEIGALRDMIAKDEKIGRFLDSPTVVFAAKRKLIESVLKSFSRTTQHFLLVLIDRNRATLIGQIVEAFNDHADKIAGIATVDVQSARKLEDAEVAKLKGIIEAKLSRKVKLREAVKPELLGGLVLVHEDKMWDSSVAHSLRKLYDQMDSLKLTTIKWSE